MTRPSTAACAGRRAAVIHGLLAAALLAGCDARFDDLRSENERARDVERFGDGGARDAADGGADDGAPGTDGGAASDAAPPSSRLLARGTFEGRTGYRASGEARLLRDADGALVLELGADFTSQTVPGPVVLLSTRDRIGNAIDPDRDAELGILAASTGAQRYAVPEDAASAGFAWVYCRPFRVEVAVAALEDVP